MHLIIGLLVFFVTMSAYAFDPSTYVKRKAANTITLSKTAQGKIVATSKFYDAETGILTKTEVVEIALQDIKDRKLTLQQAASDLQTLITDIQAIP